MTCTFTVLRVNSSIYTFQHEQAKPGYHPHIRHTNIQRPTLSVSHHNELRVQLHTTTHRATLTFLYSVSDSTFFGYNKAGIRRIRTARMYPEGVQYS